MHAMTFTEFGIRHRMVSLRMLYSLSEVINFCAAASSRCFTLKTVGLCLVFTKLLFHKHNVQCDSLNGMYISYKFSAEDIPPIRCHWYIQYRNK